MPILNWVPEDTNEDGEINGEDIPYSPGSPAAKAAWKVLENQIYSEQSIQKARAMGYENAIGMYGNKPLVPGIAENQADFQYLIDKLVYEKGYSQQFATSIVAKTRYMLSH